MNAPTDEELVKYQVKMNSAAAILAIAILRDEIAQILPANRVLALCDRRSALELIAALHNRLDNRCRQWIAENVP